MESQNICNVIKIGRIPGFASRFPRLFVIFFYNMLKGTDFFTGMKKPPVEMP